jgi:hypothetical protein
MTASLASFLLLTLIGGVLSQAPAPAPLAQKPNTVNGLFVTTAASITFVNESTLALAGVPTSTEWVKFPPQPAASALPQDRLTSPYLQSRTGRWAGAPQAALSGLYNGQPAHVLLQLDRPTYSAISHMMTFQYVVLAMNSTRLPAVGGTVNDYVMRARDADSKTHNSTLSAVMPGTTFYAASLVMDIVGIEQYTTDVMARTEDGLIHVDLGEDNLYYYG